MSGGTAAAELGLPCAKLCFPNARPIVLLRVVPSNGARVVPSGQ